MGFISHYPANVFSENVVCSSCLLYFRRDFILEVNTMNHDQTAPKEQSDLGPYCLQYMVSKNQCCA